MTTNPNALNGVWLLGMGVEVGQCIVTTHHKQRYISMEGNRPVTIHVGSWVSHHLSTNMHIYVRVYIYIYVGACQDYGSFWSPRY